MILSFIIKDTPVFLIAKWLNEDSLVKKMIGYTTCKYTQNIEMFYRHDNNIPFLRFLPDKPLINGLSVYVAVNFLRVTGYVVLWSRNCF